jgi:hypothetical protein
VRLHLKCDSANLVGDDVRVSSGVKCLPPSIRRIVTPRSRAKRSPYFGFWNWSATPQTIPRRLATQRRDLVGDGEGVVNVERSDLPRHRRASTALRVWPVVDAE